jgi:hypothetical protein
MIQLTWGMLPFLIKANTILGAVCFLLCCIPKLFKMPRILIPAFVFFQSVGVLLVWGVLNS